jgi:hypothetical protein
MGNLSYAGLGCVALASALVSAASPPGPDPNDRVWIEQYERAPALPLETAVTEVAGGFTTAVVSWNVSTSGGSALAVDMRARLGGRWTKWYSMGVWSAAVASERRSTAGQKDVDGDVDTDTLTLTHAADAFAVRATPIAGAGGRPPALQLLAVATSLAPDGVTDARAFTGPAREIDVPERTQRSATSPDGLGGGGDSWCSPTSVSMVMAYWARSTGHPQWDVDVAAVADGVYDPVYDGCGNWPFNVAFASEHGLAGFVRQFPSLDDVALLVSRGIPVIASIAVQPHELDGAPYPKTAGHLLVIRGFTPSGDVIVNDPYGEPGAIRRVYKRAQFAHAWLAGSNGTVYIIAPPDIVRTLR